MRIAAPFIALVCFAGSACASDASTSIIQACQTLKRQTDRNKCLEEAVRSLAAAKSVEDAAKHTPSPKPPEPSNKEIAAKRSEQVFAAALALQSVIDLGVSYNDYKPYIQKLAVELGSYKTTIQLQEEKLAAELIEKALKAYDDAREYWYADIEFYARRDNRLAYFGSLPMELAGVAHIVNRYSIPVQKSDLFGLNVGATRSTALSTIWRAASSSVDQARIAISFKEKAAENRKTQGESIGGEDVTSIAARMLITVVGHDAHISSARVSNGKFVCGTVVKNTAAGEKSHLYMLNPETSEVNIEGSDSWADWVWPTYCK